MKSTGSAAAFACAALIAGLAQARAIESVFPGAEWQTRTPAEAGLDAARLDAIKEYLGGRGCIVRHGYLVFSWGDHAKRGDVASAAKPWYAHFLFKAVEEKKLSSLDEKAAAFEPRLKDLNPALGNKDREITFRHLANQISCYGVAENPGGAFDYNDWQMALFWDTLFRKVYGAAVERVDSDVLEPLLAQPLQCQDKPTFLAFGKGERAGRLAVSPRDFARFGLLYLQQGKWKDRQLVSAENARLAVSSPLPLALPRTAGKAAEMIAGQRSIGSTKTPDNQCDHEGCYSWLWWVNGKDRDGRRKWPGAPDDVFACLGHANGMRGMAVLPGLQIVISWNDTMLDQKHAPEGMPHPLNEVFKLLVAAAQQK